RVAGGRLSSWQIVRVPSLEIARDYARRVPPVEGVDLHWYEADPPEPTGRTSAIDPDLKALYWSHRGVELPSIYAWNRALLHHALCDPTYVYLPVFDKMREIFTFEPRDGDPFPTFRFLGNRHYPSGLITNAFGWRGPQVPLNKPAGSIRIAFVGASTTVAPHADL